MGVINSEGMNVSYECSELIDDLKLDILDYGGNKPITVWCKKVSGVVIYTDYDFLVDDHPISSLKLQDGEFIKQMTMSELLPLLEKQNSIL